MNGELCRHRCLPSAIYHCARVDSRISKLSILDFQELDACFLKHVETLILLQWNITLQISQDTMRQPTIGKTRGERNFLVKHEVKMPFSYLLAKFLRLIILKWYKQNTVSRSSIIHVCRRLFLPAFCHPLISVWFWLFIIYYIRIPRKISLYVGSNQFSVYVCSRKSNVTLLSRNFQVGE